MSAGGVSSKTTGYLIWGKNIEQYAGLRSNGEIGWADVDVHVYKTLPDLLAALADGDNANLGPLTIHRQVETTYQKTDTDRVPLE